MRAANIFLNAFRIIRPFAPVVAGLIIANATVAILTLVEPLVLGKIIDVLAEGGDATVNDSGIVFQLFGLWVTLGLITIIVSYYAGLYADKMGQRMRLSSIAEFTSRALRLPIQYHDRAVPSQAFQTLMEGSNTLWVLWLSFFRENCSSFLMLLLLCPVTFFVNWLLAIPLVVLVIAVYALFSASLIRAEQAQVEAETRNSQMLNRAADLLVNVKLVQAFDQVDPELKELACLQEGYLSKQEPLLKLWALTVTAGRAASTCSMLVIFGFGLWLRSREMASMGEVIGFAFIAQTTISRLDAVSIFLSTAFQYQAKLERFFEIIHSKTSIEMTNFPSDMRLQGEIKFENVSFRYANGNDALSEVTFQVRAGTMTALVGRSGSGKTTVLSLLCGFYHPSEGRIMIDEHPLDTFSSADLRRNIGIMFQDSMTLSRSLEDNVKFGARNASLAEVENAMRCASVYELYQREKALADIRKFTEESAIGLSGGERQRLSLARLFLKNPPIILLDEPTSAADSSTEAELQKSLDSLLAGKTSIVVAHKYSTILKADQIVVLEEGRVAEIGSFQDLVHKGGVFSELLKLQYRPDDFDAS